MASINNLVWRLIAEDLSVQKDLRRGLINVRGLARYLIQKHHLKASMDAVISAIRRYEAEGGFEDNTAELEAVFSSAIITTKNHVTCVTMRDAEYKTVSEDFVGKGILKDNFRLIKSKETVRIFLNQKNIEQKLELFDEANIKHITRNLAEIRVQMTSDTTRTVGVLARLSHEIALHGVSIYEIISSVPEFLIYVKSEDLVRAHKAVLSLISSEN